MPPKDRRRIPRSVWDAQHPVWRVLQGVVSIGLIAIAGDHLTIGAATQHAGGVDAADVVGVGGVAVGGRLLWQMFRRKFD